MMLPFGHEVIEYSNEGSESEASEHVVILEKERFRELKKLYKQEQPNEAASTDSTIYKEFSEILNRELLGRVRPGDIICHPFGIAHSYLGELLPQARHVEIGIGYTQCAFPLRIYETYTWWAWHQGKEQAAGNAYQWVCPMMYDTDHWEPSYEDGKYLLYFGRVIECKGLQIVKEIARNVDMPVKVVGESTPEWLEAFLKDAPKNLTYHSPVTGKDRSELLRNAYAMLMPTLYTEPFGGAGVEGQLCGTPLLASDFGAFSETVIHGYSGYRCKTLGDWLQAVRNVKNLNRRAIASSSRAKYSLQSVGSQMDKIMRQIENLDEKGWYSVDPSDAIWM
jgi:glycosyltransferase involved in cell wall biosynthesis